MELLRQERGHTQTKIVGMMYNIGHSIGESTFTNILKGGGGYKTVLDTARAFQKIMAEELGMGWADGAFTFTASPGFSANEVPSSLVGKAKKGHVAYENRRIETSKKALFFKEAQVEVIEFGATLGRFASNLNSGNREELRVPVETLLNRGVNFKCYLAKDSQPTLMYFNDRGLVHPEELHYKHKLEIAKAALASVQSEFANAGFKGKFEVFEYEHLPHCYFMVVDPGKPHGKMLVSHYLYGVRRGETPVYTILKRETPVLFHTYWDSLTALMKNAKLAAPPKS